MRQWQRWAGLTALALGLGPWPAAAQTTLYAGGGLGYTAVLDHGGGNRPANRNWFGMLGVEGRGPLGGRLEGAETISRLWLSADLIYRLSTLDHPVRPYAAVGGGFVMDLSEVDPLLTFGTGLRVQVRRLMFLFAELRLQWVPAMPSTSAMPELVLPFTLGLGIGY